tara:strand:- start:21 stop:248 length:228 start_codon:yes stop_codon:yes gene_type:complete
MQKIRFHNSKITDENLNKKQLHQTQNLDPKIVVDINKLLNRVKIEEKSERKRKIIFFSLAVLVLSLVGTFISVIK